MPGVQQLDRDSLVTAAMAAATAGVGGVMLFGIPAVRDACGSAALEPDGVLNAAVRAVSQAVAGRTLVMADLCLDEFTDHGHCGVLTAAGRWTTMRRWSSTGRWRCSWPRRGGRGGAQRDDGRPGRGDPRCPGRRRHPDVAILAYAAKYASAFYGPFRDAVDSTPEGDRRTYQQDPANRREAAREVALDLAEGADMVMVKPALAYLDVLSDTAQISPVPVLAYQVSGEMAMVEAAAERGWLDRRSTILETLTAIRRAGADGILTYWAVEVAGWLAADS